MRMSKTTTGTVLFGLDAVLVLAAWPLVLLFVRPGLLPLSALPMDARGWSYPLFDLLLLFAMGLYRREAVLELGRSLTRVPLVVAMGAALAVLLSFIQPVLIAGAATPGGQTQAVLFALAFVAFTVCAFAARIVIDLLLRQHVLRRRLLIIGAGQRAWDLLLMLGREGSSLHDEVALLHDAALGEIDPRLAKNPPGRIHTPGRFRCRSASPRWSQPT